MAPRIEVIAALAFLLPQVATSQIATGCLTNGFAFNNRLRDDPTTGIADVLACQALCAAEVACANFGYFPESQECYLGAAGGNLEVRPGALSGQKGCIAPAPACDVSPALGFENAENASEAAKLWPIGYQPAPLQCWPISATGTFQPCGAVTVVEDRAVSWPGWCKGLVKVELEVNQTCESNCRLDEGCSSWQSFSTGDCYQGLGEDCFKETEFDEGVTVTGAQRMLRGQYRVLAELPGLQIMGLLQVFNQENANMTTDPASACRNVCLSLTACQYWQLSKNHGCYIEGAGAKRSTSWEDRSASVYNNKPVGYPLSGVQAKSDALADAHDMVAGEFIQRSCTAQPIFPFMLPPVKTPVTGTTELAAPLVAGATTLQLVDVSGLSPGMQLTVSDGTNSDTMTIASVAVDPELKLGRRLEAGSILVSPPPQHSYPAGASVQEVPTTTPPLAPTPTAGPLPAALPMAASDSEAATGFWGGWMPWLILLLIFLTCVGLGIVGCLMRGKGLKGTNKRGLKKQKQQTTEMPGFAQSGPTYSALPPPMYGAPPVPQQNNYSALQQIPQGQPLMGVDPYELFDRLDRNRDGIIDRSDFEAAGLVPPAAYSMPPAVTPSQGSATPSYAGWQQQQPLLGPAAMGAPGY